MLCTLNNAKLIAKDLRINYRVTADGLLIDGKLVPFIQGTTELEVIAIHVAVCLAFRKNDPNKIKLI
jgi:hypothetical protein